MNLNGRRESSNVSDRRSGGGGGGKKIGAGIGAVIIAAIIAWISGGNPLDVLISNAGSFTSGSSRSRRTTPLQKKRRNWHASPADSAGTEDVWTKIFARMGKEYEAPTRCSTPMPSEAPAEMHPHL